MSTTETPTFQEHKHNSLVPCIEALHERLKGRGAGRVVQRTLLFEGFPPDLAEHEEEDPAQGVVVKGALRLDVAPLEAHLGREGREALPESLHPDVARQRLQLPEEVDGDVDSVWVARHVVVDVSCLPMRS